MMSAEEVIEGNVKEVGLVARGPQAIEQWTPRLVISVDEAVELVEQKRDFMRRVMREGEHYGPIPGTGEKKVLLKPGAEVLLSSMGLHPRYRDSAPAIEDWTGDEHGGEPFFRYRKTCAITRQVGPGPDDYMVIAEATGNCNSWEEKYRWRDAALVCPECGKAAIIKGKAEYGGGWLCFKKKGGCGAKFGDRDPKITSQAVGKVPNPNIADLANTIEKMADKRALVAATLLATGCSDIFTQDVGDVGDDGEESPPPADPEPRASAAQSKAGVSPAAAAPKPPADANVDTLTEEVVQLGIMYRIQQLRAFGSDPDQVPAEKMRADVLAELDKSALKKYGSPLAKLNATTLKELTATLASRLEEAQ